MKTQRFLNADIKRDNKMIWIFISEDNNIIIPFQGSEQEAYDY